MVRWLYDWPRKCHEYINNFTLDLLAKKEGVKSQKISHSVCKLPAIILRQDKQQHLLMQNSLQRIDQSWCVKSVTINIQQRLIDTLSATMIQIWTTYKQFKLTALPLIRKETRKARRKRRHSSFISRCPSYQKLNTTFPVTSLTRFQFY